MKKVIFITILGLVLSMGTFLMAQRLPDLDLKELKCYKNKLDVYIVNKGGKFPKRWRAVANIYYNGVKKGHIDLKTPTVRTGGGIEKPNGSSRYLTSFPITAPVLVDIFIDATNDIRESNEGNNYHKGIRMKPCAPTLSANIPKLTATLVQKPTLTLRKLPDLVIRDIIMDAKCFIHVVAGNAGPGAVPNAVWDLPHLTDDAGVYLWRMGTPWGGQMIWKFDPGKNLQPMGGTKTMHSNLQVVGLQSITAEIDKDDKVDEANEKNNRMTKRFECKLQTDQPDPDNPNDPDDPDNPNDPGDPTDPNDPTGAKKAVWRITNMSAGPNCYKSPAPDAPEFSYDLKFEFKSLPQTLPEGHLVVEGTYVSNTETSTKPMINLSAMTAAWPDGTNQNINWDGRIVRIYKITKKHIVMKVEDGKIGSDIKGNIKIYLKAHSKDASGLYHTDAQIFTYPPCPPVLTHVP